MGTACLHARVSDPLNTSRWRSLYGRNEHRILMVPLEMMHTTLQTCALGAHMRTDTSHDRILSTFCTVYSPYAVEAMSLHPTTALAARTTVLTSASTQSIAMDTAEAPECMRAHRLAGESTGTGEDSPPEEPRAWHLHQRSRFNTIACALAAIAMPSTVASKYRASASPHGEF